MGFPFVANCTSEKERKFSSFCIGEFFVCDDNLYIKTDFAEALNLNRVKENLKGAYEDFDDDAICEDVAIVLKIV